MRRNKPQAGFALIEMIVGIMIISIAFVGAMYVYAEIQTKSSGIEITLRATSLANSIMGVIRSHNFDENSSAPWSGVLGPEEGLSSNYDDVDDYIAFPWSVPGYDNYSVSTQVFYVDPSLSWLNSAGSITYYKRITVTVDHSGLTNPILLTSLITPHDL